MNLNEIPREIIQAALDRSPFEATDLGCHIWLGSQATGGYGSVSIHGKSFRAHRAAWVSEHGPVPDGLDICHRCDIRLCFRPYHLFAGTRQDNMLDCIAKGRAIHQTQPWAYSRGTGHGSAKLTDELVAEIYLSPLTCRELGKLHSVHETTVGRIKHGELWPHITSHLTS